MKKLIGTLLLLSIAATAGLAQEKEESSNYPYWTISKEVQRMQYKAVQFTPVVVTTGGASAITKEVQKINYQPAKVVTVKMTGTPPHVISKGVARRQFAGK